MNAPFGCHAISLTPVRFDTWRAAPPTAGITKTLPPERKAIEELSGDQRALGGGPGSLESRRKPEPSALTRHRCATRRLAGQSAVDSMKVMARPSGAICGSPMRGMLRRSTSVMGRLACELMLTLEHSATHDASRAIELVIPRGMKFELV